MTKIQLELNKNITQLLSIMFIFESAGELSKSKKYLDPLVLDPSRPATDCNICCDEVYTFTSIDQYTIDMYVRIVSGS